MCPEMQFKPRAVSPFPSCVILAKRCHHQLIQNFRLVSSDANLFSLKMKKKKMYRVSLHNLYTFFI
jgi:hypothetical protein